MHPGIAFPDIDPVAFQFGWIIVRWYSLAYIGGLFLAWALARHMSRKTHSTFTVLKIDDFLIWATIGIIAGGRLGEVLFYNPSYYWEFPLEIVKIWQGGMSFHGGLLGVVAATILFARKKEINLFDMADILACVAPIGLFLGRLANFVNAELYGRATTAVPWAMIFPDGGPQPRHPSQIYEALLEGALLFAILNAVWWLGEKYRRRKGFTAGLFFILYGVFRFAVEFFREPETLIDLIVVRAPMGQLLCVPMILFGWWLIVHTSPRHQMKKI